MQTLNKSRGLRASDIEKEHGVYMTDKIRSAVSRVESQQNEGGLPSHIRFTYDSDDDAESFESESVDAWGEFEAAEGFGYEEYMARMGYTSLFDSTRVPQMEGVHSSSSTPSGSSSSDDALFTPDSSLKYYSR